MATRKKKSISTEPIITKGSHLTVTTFPDGKTMLEWDHDQLLKEVQAAIAKIKKPKRKSTKSK
jgi:hypothetical protein